MATRKLVVYPDMDLMVQAGAQRFALALLDLLAERLPDSTHRTRVDVALSGGSAAQPLGLVLDDPLAEAIDWSRVHFWWSDERFVPAYDTDRNALEARRLLLDKLVADGKLPESNIHEMAADVRSTTRLPTPWPMPKAMTTPFVPPLTLPTTRCLTPLHAITRPSSSVSLARSRPST